MKNLTYCLLISLSLYSATALADNQSVIVGYYANWSNVPFTALPVKNLDLINYAFASPQSDGSIKLMGTKDNANFKDIAALKKQRPNLKVVLSVGGWTLSQSFSTIAANPNSIKKFADSAAALMQKYPDLDGIDIDWEYPVSGGDNIPHKPEDKDNYVLLVKTLREKLDSLGTKHYLITIAGPHHSNQGDGGSVANIAVKKMLAYIDHINIMDYDIHQSTSEPTRTNNDAALFQTPNNPSNRPDSVNDSINDYKKQGLTAAETKQLIMGIPLYGFAWNGVSDINVEPNHPGLYAPAQGKLANPYAPGSDGIFTYADIMNHLINDQKMEGVFSEQYKFSTYYSATNHTFVTFDDIQTVKAKADYIKKNGLGGAMFWELSNDTFDKNSLVYHTCLALGANDSCTTPTPLPTVKMKVELTNNDPKNSITITFVTADKSAYYAFPSLAANSSATYNENTSNNVAQLIDKSGILILLTAPNGQQRWCPGTLNMRSNSYHHIQVYYDNVPNCLIQ